ncbi:TssQ family T6SS-associated lipoprotein [Pseudoduganella violaceinigra]|uniref:TssQ family T6SS-associated lipoprotein n=1 Tax=Pseudoduganella violaceinigra TaxID=246602 RepID=UPI0004136861|nr:TssQ family T6SS-associated lipoprotein [Pseudoduganella violaceinigra]
MKSKLFLIAAAALLAGCETFGPQPQHPAPKPAPVKEPAPAPVKPPPPVVAPAPPEPSPARKAVNTGIDLYKAGNFNGAIKQLGSIPDLAKAEPSVQLDAIKYTAFSYCVTNRTAQCRQQFVKGFKLDKSFDLSPGEKGHPLWTPSFESARKEVLKKK